MDNLRILPSRYPGLLRSAWLALLLALAACNQGSGGDGGGGPAYSSSAHEGTGVCGWVGQSWRRLVRFPRTPEVMHLACHPADGHQKAQIALGGAAALPVLDRQRASQD